MGSLLMAHLHQKWNVCQRRQWLWMISGTRKQVTTEAFKSLYRFYEAKKLARLPSDLDALLVPLRRMFPLAALVRFLHPGVLLSDDWRMKSCQVLPCCPEVSKAGTLDAMVCFKMFPHTSNPELPLRNLMAAWRRHVVLWISQAQDLSRAQSVKHCPRSPSRLNWCCQPFWSK